MKILSHFTLISMFAVLLFVAQSSTVFAQANNTLQNIHDKEETRILNASNSLTLSGVISRVMGLINQVIPVLFALALVFFMWSCVQYVRQSGESGGEARSNVLWGLIALFVIFSIWGLVNILCVTLLGGSCSR